MKRHVFPSTPMNLGPAPAGPPKDVEVRSARARDDRANTRNCELLVPAISAHLDSYQAAVTELRSAHERIAEQTDLDLHASDRPSSLWLLSGRALSIGDAALALLRDGYATETAPLLRSLHECNRLLSAVMHDDQILQIWLRDRGTLSFRRVMAAVDAWERQSQEQMMKDGVPPPSRTKDPLSRTYGRLSDFTHHRRRHLVDQVSVPTRRMPIGPHPDIRVRAAVVWDAGPFLGELVTVAGSALATLLGRHWFVERFQPTFEQLQVLRQRIDISPRALEPRPSPARAPIDHEAS
jgi:hypothetical protein